MQDQVYFLSQDLALLLVIAVSLLFALIGLTALAQSGLVAFIYPI